MPQSNPRDPRPKIYLVPPMQTLTRPKVTPAPNANSGIDRTQRLRQGAPVLGQRPPSPRRCRNPRPIPAARIGPHPKVTLASNANADLRQSRFDLHRKRMGQTGGIRCTKRPGCRLDEKHRMSFAEAKATFDDVPHGSLPAPLALCLAPLCRNSGLWRGHYKSLPLF
jgi:hypothetical protein